MQSIALYYSKSQYGTQYYDGDDFALRYQATIYRAQHYDDTRPRYIGHNTMTETISLYDLKPRNRAYYDGDDITL